MLDVFKQFFSPPIFPNDPAKTHLSKTLYTLVNALLILLAMGLVATLFIYVQKVMSTLVLLTIIGSLFIVKALVRHGSLRGASFLYISMLWGIAAPFLYIGSGTSSPELGLLVAITTTAAVLLGIRWAVFIALLNSLLLLLFAWLEINNYPFPHLIPEPPFTRWINFSMFLFMTLAPVYLMLNSLSDALKNAQQEIENRKQTELLLRESESRLNGIITSALDAIVVVNAQQKITLFNPTAEAVFGYSTEGILGESLSKLIPERFRQVHEGYVEVFGSSGEMNRYMRRDQLSGLRSDGTEFPIEASIS